MVGEVRGVLGTSNIRSLEPTVERIIRTTFSRHALLATWRRVLTRREPHEAGMVEVGLHCRAKEFNNVASRMLLVVRSSEGRSGGLSRECRELSCWVC